MSNLKPKAWLPSEEYLEMRAWRPSPELHRATLETIDFSMTRPNGRVKLKPHGYSADLVVDDLVIARLDNDAD